MRLGRLTAVQPRPSTRNEDQKKEELIKLRRWLVVRKSLEMAPLIIHRAMKRRRP